MKTPTLQSGSTRARNSVARPVAMMFALSTIALSGCGGGGGSSSPTPTPIDLTQAQAQLNSVVRGTTAVTTANLTPIASQFDAARTQDGTNKNA